MAGRLERKKPIMTMQQIADLVGVSRTAVSAVINKRRGTIRLNEATRRKIEAVLQDTNFRPNTVGRALALGRSLLIGVVLDQIAQSFTPQAIQGIEDVAEKRGYGILLMTFRGDPERQRQIVEFMFDRRVDGIILGPGFESRCSAGRLLREKNMPVMYMCHRPADPLPGSHYVCVDGVQIGYLAGRHLLRMGYQHIACVTANDWVLKGVDQAVAEHMGKMPFEYWPWENSPDQAKRIFERWLKADPRPSAILVHSDDCACQIMNLAIRRGIRIPTDLALMGIDDIPAAREAIIPLTTVNQPKYEQGWSAAEVLLDLIDGKSGKDIILQPRLVRRQTT